MERLFIMSLLFLSLMSCNNTSDCASSDESKLFKNHLSVIKNVGEQEAFGEKEYFSIFFLEKITSIPSNASYGDISLYDDNDQKNADIEEWKNWLETNACDLTFDKLNLVESEIRRTNTWLNLKD